MKNKQHDTSFSERCYAILRQIPVGQVTTYKEIAQALNCKAYRAVGTAMSKNPNAPHVPCHRVVASDGSLGGYAYGLEQKISLLQTEGVAVADGRVVDFEQKLYRPSPLE